jgi:hypothetical protein
VRIRADLAGGPRSSVRAKREAWAFRNGRADAHDLPDQCQNLSKMSCVRQNRNRKKARMSSKKKRRCVNPDALIDTCALHGNARSFCHVDIQL